MLWELRVKMCRVRSCRPEARDVYVSDSLSLVHCDTMLAGRGCGAMANAGRSHMCAWPGREWRRYNGRLNDMVVWAAAGAQATAASRGAQRCSGHLVASGDHRDVACPRRDSNVWPRIQPTAHANAVALPGRAL